VSARPTQFATRALGGLQADGYENLASSGVILRDRQDKSI
jgi:hypothetical protein